MQNIKRWINSNYDYIVTINKNDFTESLVVDVDSEKYIARFTLWDDYSCVLEIIDVMTEQYVINERRELSSDDDVIKIFKEFDHLLNKS